MSDAYGARSAEYIEAFGRIETTAAEDRSAVLAWARTLTGRVVDMGCGPGQWAHFLADQGVDVEGVDPTPEFIAAARRAYPGVGFRIGRAEHLEVEDRSLGGILSWYSLIHMAPDVVDSALDEFARGLRAGGGLAIGFFAGPELCSFDHAVTAAYAWPIHMLAERVEACGFTVSSTEQRDSPGTRTHGLITATR